MPSSLMREHTSVGCLISASTPGVHGSSDNRCRTAIQLGLFSCTVVHGYGLRCLPWAGTITSLDDQRNSTARQMHIG